jgi:hypothetical protein
MKESPVETTASVSNKAIPRAAKGLLEETKALIRKNPARALAIAAGAGFVLQSAPVGRLVGGLLRVSFALLPPALMVVGGVKLWEKIQRRQIL